MADQRVAVHVLLNSGMGENGVAKPLSDQPLRQTNAIDLEHDIQTNRVLCGNLFHQATVAMRQPRQDQRKSPSAVRRTLRDASPGGPTSTIRSLNNGRTSNALDQGLVIDNRHIDPALQQPFLKRCAEPSSACSDAFGHRSLKLRIS